jgi:NAD-dependent SIR2 family protein deacetylase
MLIKFITVECLECHHTWEGNDADDDWDELYDMEECPECAKRVAEDL